MDYRTILIQFIMSVALCEHMGDVTNEIADVMDRIGIPMDGAELVMDLIDEIKSKTGVLPVWEEK